MLTLIEHSKLVDDPLSRGVIELYAKYNPVLERLPFDNISGAAYRFVREGTMPSVAFRAVNEAYAESSGTVTEHMEPLTIAGGDIDFDNFLEASGSQSRSVHTEMKVKSLSLHWLATFFKGDRSVEPKEFSGLQAQVSSDQTINAGAVGGGALTLAKVDEALDAVNGGADVIFAHKKTIRKINDLVRAAGSAMEPVDSYFGRRLTAYAGVPLVPVETDETGTDILGYTEDDGAGNPDTTSLYCVRFGVDGVQGIQIGPMQVHDLGQLDSKPAKRTRVEWFSSYAIKHPAAVSRLRWINA